MDAQKLDFISSQFTPLVKTLTVTTAGKWGKMNAQQMTEHVTDFFRVSSEKIIFALQTPVEHLPKYKEFLLSDKIFRENTRGPESILPEEPFPVRNNSFEAATDELQKEINDFIQFFKEHPERKTVHPVFGELNFEEWVLLHYKHITHHARQFGLIN